MISKIDELKKEFQDRVEALELEIREEDSKIEAAVAHKKALAAELKETTRVLRAMAGRKKRSVPQKGAVKGDDKGAGKKGKGRK